MSNIDQITEEMLSVIDGILNSHEFMRHVDQVDELIKILEENYDIQID